MATVIVKVHAELFGGKDAGWEVGSEHAVDLTPKIDALVGAGYLEVTDDDTDTEPETLGAVADLEVQTVQVPSDDAGTEEWRTFLVGQGVPYTVDQAQDAEGLKAAWQANQA